MAFTMPDQYNRAADLIYKVASLTSFLDNGEIQIVGRDIKIKQISVDGAAAMGTNGQYVSGSASASWVTKSPNYDRGRKFSVDAKDESEFGGLYMDLIAEYIRTKLVPELDADRLAKFLQSAGTKVEAALSTAANINTAINTAAGVLDTNEVPTDGRILFIESSKLRSLQSLDTTVSRETLASFARIVPVPQGRFYSYITKYDGTTSGQTAGGYIRYGSQYDAWAATTAYTTDDYIEASGKVYHCTTAGTSGSSAPTWPSSGTVSDGATAVWTYVAASGHNINFMIIHPTAILQGAKRTVTSVDEPDSDYDAFRVSNRFYGIHEVYTQKTYGVYAHYSTS